MKIKVFILVTACLLLIISFYFLFHSRTFTEAKIDLSLYVSPDGDDQNEGTKSSPLRTLNEAATRAKLGTTVFVRKGTYNELLSIKHSGTASKPITFTNYKNEKVIISGSHIQDLKEDTALIKIENKDYITIQGFTLEELATTQDEPTVMGIYIAGSSSHIRLKQNHIHHIETRADDGNAHGIAVYGTEGIKDIQILENIVENLRLGASEALVLNGNVEEFKIADNIVRKNNNIGIDLIGYEGIALQNDYVRNGVVENNIVDHNSSFGNPAYGNDYSAGGIYVDGGSNITIRNNKVHHNDIGIEATSEHFGKSASQIKITNNEVYNNMFTGISLGGYDKKRGKTKNSTISQNNIYGNDTKGLDGGQLLMQYNVANNRIEKNTVTASDSNILLVNLHAKNTDNIFTKNIYKANNKGKWIWNEEEFTDFPSYQETSNNDVDSTFLQ